jgi:hypothetical protein
MHAGKMPNGSGVPDDASNAASLAIIASRPCPSNRCIGNSGATSALIFSMEMLSADFLKTAQLLRRHYPALEIVVPLVNARRRECGVARNHRLTPMPI